MSTPHPVDGFKISPRKYVDLEEFGRIGNPSGVINVPAPDVHELAVVNYSMATQDLPPWPIGTIWDPYATDPDIADQYQPDQPDRSDKEAPENATTSCPANTNSARGKGTIMAGETTITVIGNLTNDPELRFTPVSREFGKTDGTPVVNFTIASTPRTFDPSSNEWKDGETLFLRASAWREMAENVAASLTKGSRVIASGRLRSRSYETKEGEKRTAVELEVDEIGASLRYAEANITRSQRYVPTNSNGGTRAAG